MGAKHTWPQEEIDTLIKLYREGVTYENIAHRLGKGMSSVKVKLGQLRKQYDLPYRDPKQLKPKRAHGTVVTPFDKAFSGPIPCGHWMITKKWELTDEQREALESV